MNQLYGVTYVPRPQEEDPDDPPVDPDDPDANSNWLELEQEYWPEITQYPDYNDIDAMYRLAFYGLSARQYIKPGCPVDIEENGEYVLVALPFYAMTPSDDFTYRLETNLVSDWTYTDYEGNIKESHIKGTIFNEGVTSVQKGYSTVLPMTDHLQFNHRILDFSHSWESVILDPLGRSRSAPQLEVDGRFIRFDEVAWGVLRMNYRAAANRHVLLMAVKPEGGFEFSEINPQVTAHWEYKGQTYSTGLSFEIPQCVYDALSMCPDGFIILVLLNPYKAKYIIYFNTCNGKFITICEAGSLPDDYHKAFNK
jgi:hypothetical protein